MSEKFYNWLKDGLYKLLKEENSDNKDLIRELNKICHAAESPDKIAPKKTSEIDVK